MASDVAALVSEMNDTLVDIRQTIDALSTATHTSRLDQLEHQRDSTIAALRANFERETDDLAVKRRRERDEIAERRRQEDEEIAAKRRREDEDMSERDGREDEDRERRFVSETDDVEDEMDGLMEGVETEAESFLSQGRDKLAQLEERRKELNRLIDEQVRVPFPTVTTRRRSRNQRTMDAAITSKPAPAQATGEPVNNTLKAIKEERDGSALEETPQQAGRGPLASQAEDDERVISGSENASRGSFESVGPRRSRTASVSSSQRGSRISAFGWIAGKIGLSETREEAEAGQEPENVLRPEDTAVEATPEIPDRSSARPGSMNAPETPVNGQESTPETFEVREKDAAPDLEEDHPADKATLESVVVYNVEAQVKTISPTVSDNEASSPIEKGGSHELSPAQHEVQDPSLDDQESRQEVQLTSGNTVPTYHPTDSTRDALDFDHEQPHESKVASYEGSHGTELPHDQSTASSRAESPVENAPGPDGSETTLEVESEPYQEQEFIQKPQDKDVYGGFGPEHEAVDIRDGEADAAIHGMGSGLAEDGSQMPALPTGTDDTNAEGDNQSSGPDEQRSPPYHTDGSDAAVLDVDPEDVQHGLDAHVDIAPRSVPEQQELKKTKDAQPFPSPPAVMDEGARSPGPESLVYEPTGQSLEFDHSASEVAALEQNYEENGPASGTYNEGTHHTEEAPASQYPAAEKVIATSFEPATDEALQILQPQKDTVAAEVLDEYPPIELPPHAMDYSLGLDTLQLPNGSWPAGEVDEVFLRSLIAEFLVPSVISSEHTLHGDGSMVPLSAGEEKLSSPPLEDQLDTVAPHADERNYDNELVSFVYPGFAHEIQPMTVQLASGVWSTDPTDGEFEDALTSQNAAASEIYSSTSNAPRCEVAYSSEEFSAHGAAVDAEPVAMQLPSGAWVTDPPEEEYEIVPAQTQQISIPADHVASATDTLSSPTAELHRDISSEVVQSPSHTGLDDAPLAADPEETVQGADEETAPTAQASETGSRDGTVSIEEADMPSEQVLSDNHGQTPGYGASQAAISDGTTLPWSPFNSRIPLSPETSSETSVHSPRLAEIHEATADESADAANPAGRHSTFGYGSNQAGPDAADYQIYEIPGNPYVHADMLNVTEAATDSDSQNFVTPLQSAGMQSPQPFQDPLDTFHNAVDYSHGDSPHEEAVMTVHGQDELFDSDSMSEYEPDPSVDENGDPRANLGMPPQHHAFANGHAEEATDSPNTAILQPTAGNPYQRTPEIPPAVEDNSDVSPMSLRESAPPPVPPRRGLAFSRHNPERPVTPPAQTMPEDLSSHQGTWDASGPVDSTPMSLVSHSTLSSSPGSPVRERVHEGREPMIQNSWSEDIYGDQHGHHEYEREYEATPSQDDKLDENLPTPIATHMPESVRDYSPATPSPSTLIQKMRGIFENPSGSSPVRSRPSSGIYNPPRPLESPGYDVPGERRKGGFLNEAEDEVDERSALLGSVGRN